MILIQPSMLNKKEVHNVKNIDSKKRKLAGPYGHAMGKERVKVKTGQKRTESNTISIQSK